jgi:hypothetical protein
MRGTAGNRPGLLAALACVLATPLTAQGIPEEQYVLHLRSAAQNCKGAAPETRARIAAEFAVTVGYRTIEVSSAVVTGFEDFDPLSGYDAGSGYNLPECGNAPREQGRLGRVFRMIGDTRDPDARFVPVTRGYRVVVAKKGYQDLTVVYRVVLPRGASADDVRRDQKVSFSFDLIGVRGFRLTDTSATGVLRRLLPETRMLRCGNGHEYAPASGYGFCPVDGLPLK